MAYWANTRSSTIHNIKTVIWVKIIIVRPCVVRGLSSSLFHRGIYGIWAIAATISRHLHTNCGLMVKVFCFSKYIYYVLSWNSQRVNNALAGLSFHLGLMVHVRLLGKTGNGRVFAIGTNSVLIDTTDRFVNNLHTISKQLEARLGFASYCLRTSEILFNGLVKTNILHPRIIFIKDMRKTIDCEISFKFT